MSNEAQPDDAGEPDPAARTSRIPTWVLRLLLAILVPSLIGLGSKWFYTLRPLPTPRQPAGDVTVWNSAAWARVPVDRERCYLANNEWNSTTPGSGLEQEIFVQDFDGHPGFGWRWRAPWQMYPAIIAYPEVVCGLKPWDVNAGLLLVREAGGYATDPTGADPRDTGHVVAANTAMHPLLNAAVRDGMNAAGIAA